MAVNDNLDACDEYVAHPAEQAEVTTHVTLHDGNVGDLAGLERPKVDHAQRGRGGARRRLDRLRHVGIHADREDFNALREFVEPRGSTPGIAVDDHWHTRCPQRSMRAQATAQLAEVATRWSTGQQGAK